jgi:hypothetical protein
LLFLLWSFLGGLIVAAFFAAAFFREFSPIALGDPGAVILFVPILTGFLLGVLLTDEEIVMAAGSGLLSSIIALSLITVFLYAPSLVGVAKSTQPFAAFSLSRIALSAVLLVPLVVVGSVIGRGVGDLFLPSVRVRAELEVLREETRRWHEALDRLENRPREPPERKD